MYSACADGPSGADTHTLIQVLVFGIVTIFSDKGKGKVVPVLN